MPVADFEVELIYPEDRPSIPIRIAPRSGAPSRQIDAVLDTGSNATYFGRDVAELLGFRFTTLPERIGLTGTGNLIHGWTRPIALEILPLNLTLSIDALFVDGRRDPPIIGTTDVMEHLLIGLRHVDRRLFLSRYSPAE